MNAGSAAAGATAGAAAASSPGGAAPNAPLDPASNADPGLASDEQAETESNSSSPTDWSLLPKGRYGAGIGGDALGNTVLGGPVGPKKYFIRFRATQSSQIESVTFPFLSADYPGYGAGTGGNWTLKLIADDGSENHFPTGPALAVRSVSAMPTSSAARTITFSSAPTTVEGVLYHLVMENIDANPTANYFSINSWVRLSFTEGGQLNPQFADSDWGSGYFHAGAWMNCKNSCPIAEIAYANGMRQGMSYGEASYVCPPGQGNCSSEQLVGRIDGPTRMVRERITITGGDKTVCGIGIRLLRNPGPASDLFVSLRDGANVEIASTRVEAAEVAVGPAPTYSLPATWDDLGQKARWVTAEFDDIHSLIDGQTYYLQFASMQGTYWAWVNRRLTPEYAYSSATAFVDGWAEYTIDGTSWLPLGRVGHQSDL
ncbi:MAG: hypothetical protein FJ202_13640, partial [Gemmatimonadetes bacterium]|nr:hypothetical protein [Gemmatimonadota bacterium]